jgi:cold shock protein
MPTGKIKWYDPARRYGFIVPDDGGADVHVHEAALIWPKIPNLKKGDHVEFDVRNGKEGKATVLSLRLIEGADA